MMINKAEIAQAVALLKAGKLVAMPTETVYGLGADASNEAAVHRIFAAKERPYHHPLIVHIADIHQLHHWARDIPPAALQLAKAYWPGPLTMVFKKQPHVLDVITGQQDTIGIRIPKHPVAQALLQAFGSGIAAPSANRFTRISPTTAEAVKEELGDRVDLILEGGACEVGLESTIIDMTQTIPTILRPGMITPEAIQTVLGTPVQAKLQDAPSTRAPGMHHLHYAPATPTQLMDTQTLTQFLDSSPENELIAVITYQKHLFSPRNHIKLMAMPSDPTLYAHDLYHTLRMLDHSGVTQILIEAVPQTMEWDAIRDRLSRATVKHR
jgi:L-threonylcarbamoyladenylate synthase